MFTPPPSGLKGAGGVFDLGKLEIEFSVVSDRVAATRCFLPDQKIFFLAEIIEFLKILKIWVITVPARTFNTISQKWTFSEFENKSPPTVFEINA